MRKARLLAFLLVASLNAKATEFLLLHTFEDSSARLGYLFGHLERDGEKTFLAGLEIRSTTTNQYAVLYRIERTGLYLASGVLDAPIHDDGSRGFSVVAADGTSVTIECCHIRTPNNGAMDPINIEWNWDAKRFELMKTP